MKQGLDYFGLDVTPPTALELVEAEFGLTGFAVTVKLLAYIHGGQGYYGDWNEEIALLMARRMNLEPRVLERILAALLKRGYFDPALKERYGVLTSPEIQKRYFTAAARRKELEVRPELLLADPNRLFKSPAGGAQPADISPQNVCIPPENADILPQRKGKQRKEKQSKEGKPPPPPAPQAQEAQTPGRPKDRSPKKRQTHGTYGHVRLTEEELNTLCNEFGNTRVKEYINRVDRYCQQHGKRYRDFALTLRLWLERDGAGAANKDGAGFWSAAGLSPEDEAFILHSLRNTPKL